LRQLPGRGPGPEEVILSGCPEKGVLRWERPLFFIFAKLRVPASHPAGPPLGLAIRIPAGLYALPGPCTMVGFSFWFITVRATDPVFSGLFIKPWRVKRKSFHSFHQEHHHEDLCGQAA